MKKMLNKFANTVRLCALLIILVASWFDVTYKIIGFFWKEEDANDSNPSESS